MKIKLEVVFFILGMMIFTYPIISHYYNSFHQSLAMTSYQQASQSLDMQYYNELLKNAEEYNKQLFKKGYTHDLKNQYFKQLDISEGMMGAIEINKINVYIPIYHGINDQVLNHAIGHIESSSLPIGGMNTHSILSGHTGLPQSKLFTDLDQLQIGDLFIIHILNEQYIYQVNDIYIVNPYEISYFDIQEGKDLCTLVTCTPYGINSHRLLVRGERIHVSAIQLEDDLIEINDSYVIVCITITMLFIIFIYIMNKR